MSDPHPPQPSFAEFVGEVVDLSAGLAVLRTYLDQFWERSLAAFEAAAQEQKGEQE